MQQFEFWGCYDVSEQPSNCDGFTRGDQTSQVEPAQVHYHITKYGANSIKRFNLLH